MGSGGESRAPPLGSGANEFDAFLASQNTSDGTVA